MKNLPLGRAHGLRRNEDPHVRSVHFRVSGNNIECDGDRLIFHDGQPAGGIFLGSDDEVDYYATTINKETVAGEANLVSIHQAAPVLSARDAGLAVQAIALFQWQDSVRFCESCGAELQPWPANAGRGSDASWERLCARGHAVYPRTDPAVIMAIVDDDDRLLLGHNARWGRNRFSTLAGFVEAGETLEACASRGL